MVPGVTLSGAVGEDEVMGVTPIHGVTCVAAGAGETAMNGDE